MALPYVLCCLLWSAIFTATNGQSPKFMIVAPRMLHVGIEESVWIQLEWAAGSEPPSGDVKVNIFLRDQYSMSNCSTQDAKSLILNSGNNYAASKTLQITPQLMVTCKLQNKQNRYLQLVAESSVFGRTPKVLNIPVSFKRGYIFIQTDKSIYTPKDTVQIRVYTLDHVMRPTEENIIVSIFNAQGLQVRRTERISKGSIVAENLKIPDISNAGVWKISAHYKTAPESNFTAEFEVKKYVLPNFDVKIIPEVPYFLISKDEFTFTVNSRYVYGENVAGIAYVRFGITDKNGQRTILSGLEKQITLQDGEAIIKIYMADIQAKINQPVENLLGFTFYIAASVVEKASGILEEKDLTSVKFVTSPYKVDLSKTKRYFTPGSPTQIVAEVSRVDGSSPGTVFVTLSMSNYEQKFKSDNNGAVSFLLNTNQKDKTLDIQVRADGDEGPEVEHMRLFSIASTSNSFLHMSLPNQVLSPGEALQVTLKIVTSNPRLVKKLYYIVLNKGQILYLKSITTSDLMSVQIPVTSSMIPSIRIIAYYYLASEIIANSAWVDVTDACEGKLVLSRDNMRDIQPRESFKLILETEAVSTVSLAAVDTAVYLLNSKNKLTPDKMFKAMNAYDLGCSPGGGKDHGHVFTDAGLAFVSSVGYSRLEDFGCRSPDRKKRSEDPQVLARQKVRSYPPALQRCCHDALALLPRSMSQDCNKRAQRVPVIACRNAFLECCKYAADLRKKSRRKPPGIARTQEEAEELEFADESDVQVRSSFPESWLWRTVHVNRRYSETIHVPDSITTWEIQGVGMSQGKGFCIAKPIHVRVFQRFHIHMRVPYSIKRYEQIELRPVVYNYHADDIKVKVYMEKVDGICSPTEAGSGGQILTVPGNSALSVPFTVVPIGKSNPVVTVIALGENGISDGVKKTLQVMREGTSVLEEKTYVMDPNDPRRRYITIDEELPSNLIPDGDFRSSIIVSMDSPVNMINNSLTPDGISRLIRVPRGCAEQTMILTAPGVFAIRYLDHTEKWAMLPPDRKDEGLDVMRQGITRVLEFRKADGSYGAWTYRQSSTWLTAFIVKVMSLSRRYIFVDVNELHLSADYLCSMQTGTGTFREILTVIHHDMKGGVTGTNAEVSLTAFVIIALHRSLEALDDPAKVTTCIKNGVEFLRSQLDSLSDPFPLAITAYALTLTTSDSVLKDKAYGLLMSKQEGDPKKSEMYFGLKGTALAVETTSYALLTALLRKDRESAGMMYTWLTEEQNHGGGFKSTQDTVMALESLSEYWINTYNQERNFIDVQINSLERQQKQKIYLRSEDSVQEELKSLGTKFGIEVSGKGKATVTILKMYNVMGIQNSTCSKLGLEVTLSEVDGKIEIEEDDYDYDYGDEVSDEPRDSIDWHDLRQRGRREASQPKAKEVKVSYKVCLWRKPGAHVSGMAVVDITMLSGFDPNTQDLEKLTTNTERYISHYEIHPGRLLMYFDEVPDNMEDCVAFDAIQSVRISLLQPSSAVAYDFYEPETRCTAFYGAPNKPKFINTLCSEDVCQCAEGQCPERQSFTDKRAKSITFKERQMFACYSPIVMFGYHLKVEEIKEQDAFMVYETRILEVLLQNGDVKIKPGEIRLFYQRKSCKMRLAKKEYLIMGQDGQTQDHEGRMRYILDNTFWVEEIPSPQTCSATRFRNLCFEMKRFMEVYRENGCQV
ncbi:complement C4-B-like isoform 2-T2 [Pelodytes ibericus]